jgi:pimeloyl-ACP methyl ester carboxylesterase
MNRPEDILLDTRQGRLAGLGWRVEYAPRVLCLHGWLDNAASFSPLAPLLDRLDRVALDLPGHGYSEHRHFSTRYHFVDYLFNVDAALDTLGWEDCHLVGHSLGAAIAAVYGAGAPERVRSLVLLDSMGPISVTPEGAAPQPGCPKPQPT